MRPYACFVAACATVALAQPTLAQSIEKNVNSLQEGQLNNASVQELLTHLKQIANGVTTAPNDLFWPFSSFIFHWQGYLTTALVLVLGWRSLRAVRDQIKLSRDQSSQALEIEKAMFFINATRQMPSFVVEVEDRLKNFDALVKTYKATNQASDIINAVNYSKTFSSIRSTAPSLMADSRGIAVSGGSVALYCINILRLEDEILATIRSIDMVMPPVLSSVSVYTEFFDQLMRQVNELKNCYEGIISIARERPPIDLTS